MLKKGETAALIGHPLKNDPIEFKRGRKREGPYLVLESMEERANGDTDDIATQEMRHLVFKSLLPHTYDKTLQEIRMERNGLWANVRRLFKNKESGCIPKLALPFRDLRKGLETITSSGTSKVPRYDDHGALKVSAGHLK